MRKLPAIAVAACLLGGPGCGAQPAADAPREDVAAETVTWPERAATIVRDLEVGPWTLHWVGPFGLGGLEPDRQDAAALADALHAEPDRIDFEGLGSVVVRTPEGELTRTAKIAGKPAAAYEVLTADARGNDRYQLQRTWFVLYGPRGQTDQPRGLVLLLPGMFGTPEPVVDALVGKLRDRGWPVLRMLTHPSRFTEKRAYTIDPADPASHAADIAAEFGDRAAECALATEAVCARIAETRPGTPVGARIALGMSGGGMVTPTVVARELNAYDSAVFIGAGCDFAEIAALSSYADWIDSARVGWSGDPTDEMRQVFRDAYRAAAPLDGYATAPRLRGLPMLMLHGEADEAVPAALGDLLWRRLGEPERWTVPLGHEALFLAYLPTRFDDLLDWLDALP